MTIDGIKIDRELKSLKFWEEERSELQPTAIERRPEDRR